jgi:hypothetical protein
MDTLPVAKSIIPGNVRTATCKGAMSAKMALRRWREMDGKAIKMSVMFF